MAVPVQPLYTSKPRHGQLFAALGFIGFCANLAVLFLGQNQVDKETHKLLSQLTIGTWVLLPPLWFFYEFFYYFPANGNPLAGFERLKSVQEVSSKVWAAVAVVLAGIYSVRFP